MSHSHEQFNPKNDKNIQQRAEEIINNFKEAGGSFIRPEAEEEASNEIQRQLALENREAIPHLQWKNNKWELIYDEPEWNKPNIFIKK